MHKIAKFGLLRCAVAIGLLTPASAQEVVAELRIADLGQCETISGEVIFDCRIGYRTAGTLNEDRSNAILVPTWFRGTSEGLLFLADPQIIDPESYFIVFVDAIGNGVSISPSNSASQPLSEFPQLRITDMVGAQHRLLAEELGIERLHAVVGISMGGMQAFEWAVRYPEMMKYVVSAVGSPQSSAFDILSWTTQNRLIAMGRDCRCVAPFTLARDVGRLGSVPQTLNDELSREEALIGGAGTPETMPETMPETVPDSELEKTWDGQRQAEAMIHHDIARLVDGDLAQVARLTKAEFLIVVSRDDRVVTPEPALAFAELAGAKSLIFDAGCGHGDFRCNGPVFHAALRAFLAGD
jgi:homoserine O-acetyltransferase